MSRGLYQLSYGSNSRNMPPFPPFGKKKDVPGGIFLKGAAPEALGRAFPDNTPEGAFRGSFSVMVRAELRERSVRFFKEHDKFDQRHAQTVG